jgi:hypothetical protein
VLIERSVSFEKELRYAAVLVITGIIIFLVRSKRRREWPFAGGASGAG